MKKCICENCNSDIREVGYTKVYPDKSLKKIIFEEGHPKFIEVEEDLKLLLHFAPIGNYCNRCYDELESSKLMLLFI